MKTNYVETHDYITVSVIAANGARLNLTSSRSRGKVSSSIPPAAKGSADAEALQAAFRDRAGALRTFMQGPKTETHGVFMRVTEAAGKEATDMAKFIELLGSKLKGL